VGSVKAHGFLPDAVIVSDDAGQFNVGRHGLCWVHSERLVHKLDTFTDENRAAKTAVRKLIWEFYRDLKCYRGDPSKQRKTALQARFDHIFKRNTGFITLDRLLAWLHAKKPELLMVLDRPEIPLHTNGSENDMRCHVTMRKVNGGTRSDLGRDCRDAFLGIAKTCAKLEIAFWDYLGARLAVPGRPGHSIPARIDPRSFQITLTATGLLLLPKFRQRGNPLYLAVLTKRPTSAPRYDIFLLRNRVLRVSARAIPPRVDC
jgi:transposase IS66 family protein